jgi:2,4-dienoyl-CoA reductase-like NADH-dependent reductase (Old Yellow Enzyme family)
MAELFSPLRLRGIELPNRIMVSPMCQYSSTDGFANDWHLVHLGSRAVGGAGLVFTEATAITPEGRISPQDLGIWKDDHIEFLSRIVRFIHEQGAHSGIQLAHSGRKGSTFRPWEKQAGEIAKEDGGWQTIAPSGVKFATDYPQPRELDKSQIAEVVRSFAKAAERAVQAGFHVIEIHSAHGYLLHEFLSPLSNRRSDEYGGSLENRSRIVRDVVNVVRRVVPESMPVLVRISSTDWKEGGWDVEQSIELARMIKPLGVDMIDCSSGGNVADAKIPVGPGYQVPFAERVRKEGGIMTGAVGLITETSQANNIVKEGKADAVLIAREFLRDPYLPLHAAQKVGAKTSWPAQYLRAAPSGTGARDPLE